MSMRSLTRATRRELSGLHMEVRRLASERDLALRVFLASRVSTVRSGQREFWLELVWLTEEYRFAVRRLVDYCTEINELVRPDRAKVRSSDKRMTHESGRLEP